MLKKLASKYHYSLILLRELVKTDFKIKYQDSVLGYVWSVLKPIFMFAILYTVFGLVLKVGANIEHWPVALLAGIVLWQFFTDVTSGALKSIVNNGGLLRKINFPRYIIVVANSASAFITLAINSMVVLVFAILNGVELSWGVLLIPPLILELFIFALGTALFLSAVYVKFRDVQYIWDITTQALFYGSAIIFPISLIALLPNAGEFLVRLALANPISQVIQDIRHFAISPEVPSLWTISGGNIWFYVIPLTVTLLAFIIGVSYFRNRSPYFAEDV
jgi:ABC-2 type transport system permease protein